ncbi:MAG: hypothetical protein V4621_01110 [Pseudomonadota bacterium]
MNIHKNFRTAALLAGTALSAAFASSAFAGFEAEQCTTKLAIQQDGQGSVLQSNKLTTDGRPLPTMHLYTSTSSGERGLEVEWTPGSECFLVKKVLTDIRMQDPKSNAVRADFVASNPTLYKSLRSGVAGGGWPSLQAKIVSGDNKGDVLTVVKSPNLRALDGQLTGIVLLSTQKGTHPTMTVYNPNETDKATPLYGSPSPTLAVN